MPIPPRLPDLVSLYLFLDVVETGSISQAAERCGMSQPSASQRLQHLERRLGVRLLERSPGGTTVTDPGRVLTRWATELVTATNQMWTAVEALRANASDEPLGVCASYTIAEYLLPVWLMEFHRRQPDAAVALDVRNSRGVEEQVRSRSVHLGFVESPHIGSGLRHQVIAEDGLVVVVGSDHLWFRRSRPVTPPMLVREPLVMREEGSGTRDTLVEALVAAGHGPPKVSLSIGSTAAVIRAVLNGAGPAVISEIAAAPEVAAGRLRIVPVRGLDLRRNLTAVWRSDHSLSGHALELVRIAQGHSMRHPHS
jgi:molybdate transport repressor ModE-like protein